MPLIPLLPILTPLVGAIACLLPLGDRAATRQRRWFYVAVVALTGASVLFVRVQGTLMLGMSTQVPYFYLPLALLWTPLSFWAALLLFGGLVIGQVSRLHLPLARENAGFRLVLLAASLGVLAAGNLVSLNLAWGAQLVVLLALRAMWSGSAAERPGPWAIWSSLASTGCLMVGAVAVMAHQNGAALKVEVTPGLPLLALAAAVGLRLVGWPRAGALRRSYEVYLMSLVSGLYLWLRIGLSLNADAPLLVGGIGVALVVVVVGVMGALHRTPGRALPFVLGHWFILAMVAPFFDPQRGFVASMLIAVHVAICLLVLRIHHTSGAMPLRLGRAPYLAAWASLGGLPLTAGFIAHWLLLRSIWNAGASHLVFWVLLSYVANAIPAWSQVRMGAEDVSKDEIPSAAGWTPFASMAIAAILLVVLGVYPALLSALWPRAPLNLGVLEHGRLWEGLVAPTRALIAATLLAPLVAGLTLHPRVALARGISLQPFYRFRRTVNAEWLYAVIREQVEGVLATLGRGFEALEGSFALGWALLWGIALLYFMVGT